MPKHNNVLAAEVYKRGLDRRFLTLSIQHLPPELFQQLVEDGEAPVYPNMDAGAFVYAPWLAHADALEPFRTIGKFAVNHRFTYIFFDRDVDPIPGLPVFPQGDGKELGDS